MLGALHATLIATWTDRALRQKTLGQLFNNNFPSPAREISGVASREGAARRGAPRGEGAAAFVDVSQPAVTFTVCKPIRTVSAPDSPRLVCIFQCVALVFLWRHAARCPGRGLRVWCPLLSESAITVRVHEVQWSGRGL